ncbi:MAG: Dyp-type peroxidase [Acidimicrobiia bacterium]
MTTGISRRALLKGVAVAGAASAVGAACADGEDQAGGSSPGAADPGGAAPVRLPFDGPHQAGVAQPATPVGVVASLDVQVDDREELAEALRALSDEARRVMTGEPPEPRAGAFPPIDSGVLGAEPPPLDLSVIVGFGASLFDDRFGLADLRPRELVQMPFSANDRLDAARSHGDISLTVSGVHLDAAMFGLRQLLRATRGAWVLRWMQEGYNSPVADPTEGGAPVRNLLGFKDGTNNLDATDDELLDRFVWVQPDDGEPAWTVGGTYQAVRIIRMFVEFWDRTRLSEQEAIMGRHKASGAPLGREVETDDPRFAADPEGERIPLDSHIRLASPDVAGQEASRILRRGFSYSNGFDGADQLDQGLLFSAFQRSLDRGFRAVQARLDGEPLEEYIRPVGGGFFFCPPGVGDPDGFLGEGLFRLG